MAKFESALSAAGNWLRSKAPASTAALVRATNYPEECWSDALMELEGSARRQGVWAKAFAQAAGDEAAAKAEYLRVRAGEIHQVRLASDISASQAADVRRLVADFSDLSHGFSTQAQFAAASEAQLRVLGFEVEPLPGRWTVSKKSTGSSFFYSAEDLWQFAKEESEKAD